MRQRNYLKELELEERRRLYEDEAVESAKRVLVGVVLAGAGLLIGFNIGLQSAHAATIRAGRFKTSPIYTAGTQLVESIPETLPDDGEISVTVATAADAEKDAITADPPGERWESLGVWKLTFYCACRRCSGNWGHRTSSGATCQEGITTACAILPPGTVVKIDGYGERVVQDTGAGVGGKHLDVFMESHGECLRHGVQRREVWVKR